jgi:hypothetical protein
LSWLVAIDASSTRKALANRQRVPEQPSLPSHKNRHTIGRPGLASNPNSENATARFGILLQLNSQFDFEQFTRLP